MGRYRASFTTGTRQLFIYNNLVAVVPGKLHNVNSRGLQLCEGLHLKCLSDLYWLGISLLLGISLVNQVLRFIPIYSHWIFIEYSCFEPTLNCRLSIIMYDEAH